jgi:hypothetical protein
MAHRRFWPALLLLGCGSGHPPAPPPPGTEVAVAFEVVPPHDDGAAIRNQPPDIKLRLGHYRNRARGIGVTIDRTTVRPAGVIPPALIRFDGTDRVIVLDGQPGATGRIDYLDGPRVVLQVERSGDAAIWVYGLDGRADGPLALERDGDADPL